VFTSIDSVKIACGIQSLGEERGVTSSKLIFIFTSTVESGVVYSSEKWVFTDKTIRCEGPED